jgi:hypothetical protein
MAQWRKVIVSGSDAVLESLTVGGGTGNSGVTISAAGALTVDGATDLNSTLNVDGTITGNTSLTLDATTISTSEIGVLDGAGTSVVASKAVIADGSRDVATIRNLTLDGTFTGATHVSSSGNVTASDAYLSGDLYVDGNGTFGGNLTFGDAATDSVSFGADIDSNLIPNTDDTYDLGSSAQAWQDLFLEGDITLTDAGTIQTSAGVLTIDGAGGLTLDSDGTDAVNLGTEAAAKTITIGNAASTMVDINALALDFDSAAATDILAVTTVSVKGNTGATFGDDTEHLVYDGSGNVDFDSVALDIDSSGAITIDGTGTVSIDGADDMNFSITSGTGGEDLTIAQIGANDSSILITAAGTGTDAVSIDATAGSMVIAPSLANGKTLTIGPSSATQMVFTPHGTAASEKISLTNTAGDATDAIAVTATAGGIDIGAGTVLALDGAGGIDIGKALDVAIDVDASTFDLDASSTVHLSGSSVTLDGSGVSIAGNASEVDITTTGTVDINSAALDIDASAGLTMTSTTMAFDPSSTFDLDAAGAVTIDGSSITIGGDNDNAAINIGYSTSEVTIGDNLTVTGDLTVNGDQTIISTTNLAIEDKFAVFASGSTSATDGGIIVSNTADGSGYALGYDVGTTRWVFDANLAVNATDIAPDAYVGVVQTGTTNPAIQDPAPTYGGTTNGIGTIYIDTNASHGDQIWIYA